MFNLPPPFQLLFRRLLRILLLYVVCRFFFLLFNFSLFNSLTLTETLLSFFAGIRFDATAIIICNLPVIIFHLLPLPYAAFRNRFYQQFLKIIFLLINLPLLLLNCIDMGLFRFTGKRATADAIKIISYGDDFVNTVPKMILDFWYLGLLFFVLAYFLIKEKTPIPEKKTSSKWYKVAGLYFFSLVITVIGFRGGIQLKPLNIISASRYGNPKMAALILNTPFTFLKSYGKPTINPVHYMDDASAHTISPVLHAASSGEMNKMNVVVIIVESLGKEYIGKLNRNAGYTPFLDSLIDQSLCFPNAYANGKRSIEGIPAIVTGIPALFTEPFITSSFSGNAITSLASSLKEVGYKSVFYHGGTNGTMGFDNFCYAAGFDSYFGRTEYKNDRDFDGSWGIYDEPFLQRTILEMNRSTTPFLSVIFTLSSHHPYKIPPSIEKEFAEGTLPIHKSIRYADYSLRKFFESAQKTSWYAHTLFVITGDHTALSESDFYQNRAGMYAVPVIYFAPGMIAPKMDNTTTQQIDILPSVLDFMHYPIPYFAFGNSVFQHQNGYAYSYLNETYQVIHHPYSLIMEPSGSYILFNIEKDSTLWNDLGEKLPEGNQLQLKVKAFVQNYNRAMLENKLTYQKYIK